MIGERDDYSAMLKMLQRQLPDCDRGQLIDYDTISRIIGIEYDESGPFYRVVVKWRKWLLRERHIGTDAVPSVGIRLLTEQEHLHKTTVTMPQQARRKLKRAFRAAKVIDDSGLSLQQRKLRHDALKMLRANVKDIGSTIANSNQRPERMPIRPIK